MSEEDAWDILSDRELILNLDFQFRQCFERALPDTEELIEVLTTVHTVLHRLLAAANSSRILEHIIYCKQFDEISDLSLTLLEPFQNITKYERYFIESTISGVEPIYGKKIDSDSERFEYVAEHDRSGLTSTAASSLMSRSSEIRATPDRQSTSSEDWNTHRSSVPGAAYVPSWGSTDSADPMWQPPRFDAHVDQRRANSGMVKRPLKIQTTREERALTADTILGTVATTDLSQRLSSTTGSLSPPRGAPHESRLPERKVAGSVTPKAVGKYSVDGRRTHELRASTDLSRSSRNSLLTYEEEFNGQETPTKPAQVFSSKVAGSISAINIGEDDSVAANESESFTAMVYLSHDDLTPSAAPHKDIDKVVLALPIQDWPDVFDTLNLVRRLARFHGDRLVASNNLHAIVVATAKLVDNLRSALAKNAMLALGDLFEFLSPQSMDAEVPKAIEYLVKRSIDRNAFVSETAEVTVSTLLRRCVFNRGMSSLLAMTGHRNPVARGKVGSFIFQMLSLRAAEVRGTRDIESLLSKLQKMTSDHMPEARASARQVTRLLLTRSMISRSDMEAYLTAEDIERALDRSTDVPWQQSSTSSSTTEQSRVKATKTKPLSHTLTDSSAIYNNPLIPVAIAASTNQVLYSDDKSSSTVAKQKPSKRSPPPRDVTSSETDSKLVIAELAKECTSSVWSARVEALSRARDLSLSLYASGTLESASKCVDLVVEKLDDSNVKVSLHALSCLQHIIDREDITLLAPAISLTLPLLNASSASNKQIALMAQGILKKYMSLLPTGPMAQTLAQIAVHEKDRLRVGALRLLAENMADYSQDINTSKKVVFPAICRCLFGSKGELKVAAGEALKTMQRLNRDVRIWQWVDDLMQQDEIKRIC